MILTRVGEIGVTFGGQQHILRPSLHAISQLGDGSDIVECYAQIMQGDVMASLGMIYACADDPSAMSEALGWISYEDGRYRQHLAQPAGAVVAIAQALALHGIAGDVERTAGAQYSGTFDPRAFASVGMAQLGLTEREAWSMTMTGLMLAIQAKYPVQDGPTIEDFEAHDKWFSEQRVTHGN